MNTSTYTKAGKVSAYGFCCGYQESFNKGTSYGRLFREHGIYHIRGWVRDKHVMKTARTLQEARKMFARMKRQ